jgi:23S rRNA maturation-related 3'-5' exoribonuclease YhaM
MNEEQRMAEVEKFKNYFSYISRPGADKLLAWLEEAGFFTAPASTKYHGAYAGGLVEHTNYVYRRLVQLADTEDKRQGRTYPEYTVDTIAVAALLHDVCKVDAYKVEKKLRYTDIQTACHWDTAKSQLSRLCDICSLRKKKCWLSDGTWALLIIQ